MLVSPIVLRSIASLVFVAGIASAQTSSGVLPIGSRAELPEVSGDRPDFTESVEVVGKGILQLENGLTVEHGGGGRTFTGPELLMRLGLTKRAELRIAGDGLEFFHAPERNSSGYSDIEAGTKIALVRQGRYTPAVSLLASVSLPFGSGSMSSGGYDPTVKLALARDLPRGFSIAANANCGSVTTAEGRFRQTAASATIGHSVGGGFRAFWEVYAVGPWDRGGPPAWIADSGVTHRVGPDSLFDFRVGKRLTAAGPEWYWGFGMVFRRDLGRLGG